VIAGNQQVILSPQQLVDCVYPNGCNGGFYGAGWQYLLEQTNGQALNSTYPYTEDTNNQYLSSTGTCKYTSSWGVVKTKSIDSIDASEEALFNYVTNVGTAAISIDSSNWYLYQGNNAVFPASQCTGSIDHAVVVTGYTNINGVNVWRVRNSWGTSWGNQGYIYLPMGVNACSIGNYPQGASI